MDNVDHRGATTTGTEPLRPWTPPVAEIHSIDVIQNTSANFLNPSDGGGAPCRS